MNRETALKIVEKQLTKRRFEHTIRVTDTALKLANQFHTDRKKTELAGILHDYAKYRPKDEMEKLIREEEQLSDELLDFNLELWHAPVGAVLIEHETELDDPDVLLAIRSHTTGRANMTMLEKIIFLADYIEPGRDFPGVDKVRELVVSDIDQAIIQALSNTITHLIENKRKVHPDTIAAYNSLL